MVSFSTIDELYQELHNIQQKEDGCLDDNGRVIPKHKCRYTMLIAKARKIRGAILYIQEIGEKGF